MSVTFVADLKPKDRHKIIEAKVYRTWVNKYPSDVAPRGYCCMLLDKMGTAIQANMDFNNIQYFKQVMEEGKAYKISNFSCEETKPWQRTLPSLTTLTFGRYTIFENIAVDPFPHHHFTFVSYNQLESKLAPDSPLTDYVGCIQLIGDLIRSGDPNKRQTIRRKIDIENLNGNVVQFTMWDAMATNFDKCRIDLLPKPVMIVVTSCYVQKFYSQLQLCASPGTYYYINPSIEEVEQSITKYQAKYNVNPPLQISKQRSSDRAKEKMRNRFLLLQLLNQNPETYKYIRFTCEGMVVEINNRYDWFQYSCTVCNRKLADDTIPMICDDYGPQPEPKMRYCFRATVKDNSTTAPFTFFSPNAESITNIECSRLVKELGYTDPHELPPMLEAIKGQMHVFQFHFNPSCEIGSVNFTLDAILDDPEAPNFTLDAILDDPEAPPGDTDKTESKKQTHGGVTTIN